MPARMMLHGIFAIEPRSIAAAPRQDLQDSCVHVFIAAPICPSFPSYFSPRCFPTADARHCRSKPLDLRDDRAGPLSTPTATAWIGLAAAAAATDSRHVPYQASLAGCSPFTALSRRLGKDVKLFRTDRDSIDKGRQPASDRQRPGACVRERAEALNPRAPPPPCGGGRR